jgi:hypothetical protein
MHQSRLRAHQGIGIPSSISRDLLSTSSLSSSRETPPKTSSSSSPIIESSDGVLSKVYGSLVEPESKRQQWACHGCGQVFHRDATIFVSPSIQSSSTPLGPSAIANREKILEGGSQEHFCRQCYSDRFSMGSCIACTKPVLGSTKEDGKFVKSSGGDIWHGRCWRCVECGEEDQGKLSLGMNALPTCEDCFDQTPTRRKDFEPPASPRRGRRASPTIPVAALSGGANRSGMGATIAELSKKFGKPVPAPVAKSALAPCSGTISSSVEVRPERSNSFTGRIRPVTAQFSGTSFNLAAFQPSSPALGRTDSRSRSASPHKRTGSSEGVCSRCSRGPLDGPAGLTSDLEAAMISIPREAIHFHSECFHCAVCNERMDDSTRSFVKLGELAYAHPHCSPPQVETRATKLAMPASTALTRTSISSSSSSSTNLADHATHQRETRPSISSDVTPAPLPISYLSGAAVHDKSSLTPHASKRFQSTLLHQRPNSQSDLRSGGLASLAVSSGAPSARNQANNKFSKLGGMNTCGGCSFSVSGLEGVPGPRGIKWHKKCLVCSSKSKGKLCGKALDSSARVDEQGQVRCRQCFDCEHSRHPLRV